jgi:hypothetical protein
MVLITNILLILADTVIGSGGNWRTINLSELQLHIIIRDQIILISIQLVSNDNIAGECTS